VFLLDIFLFYIKLNEIKRFKEMGMNVFPYTWHKRWEKYGLLGPFGIPWKMRGRWHICMHFCNLIRCSCTHTLREGNMVTDAFAKNARGLATYSSQWWPSPPLFISSLLLRDSLSLPFSRIDMNWFCIRLRPLLVFITFTFNNKIYSNRLNFFLI